MRIPPNGVVVAQASGQDSEPSINALGAPSAVLPGLRGLKYAGAREAVGKEMLAPIALQAFDDFSLCQPEERVLDSHRNSGNRGE
jgi:hypothetical protein